MNSGKAGSLKTLSKVDNSKSPSKNSSRNSSSQGVGRSKTTIKISAENDVGTGTTKGAVFPTGVRPSSVRSNTYSVANIGVTGKERLVWRPFNKDGYKEPKYQNSYRLEPYLPFNVNVSDKILEKIMTENFSGVEYSSSQVVDLCRNVAADIRDKLYRTKFDRVKYVVLVSIVEKNDQSFITKQGTLSDAERDTYSMFVYEGKTFWATGMAYAFYYE